MSANSSSSKNKENDNTTTHFYAIRKCDTLERPAIFSSWKDCAVYVNGGKCDLEYKQFETSVEASKYAFQEEEQNATNPERRKRANDDDGEGDAAISKNRTAGKSIASKSTDAASNRNGITNLGVILNPASNFVNPMMNSGLALIAPMANSAANYMTGFPPIQPYPMNAMNGLPDLVPTEARLSAATDVIDVDADAKQVYFTGQMPIQPRPSGLSIDKITVRKSDVTLETMWADNIAMLLEHKEKCGTCNYKAASRRTTNMTDVEKKKHARFYNWYRRTSEQLQLYETDPESSTYLDADRVKQLNDIGFVKMEVKNREIIKNKKTWEENFEELKAFKEKNGHTNVPCLPRSSLRNWIEVQRSMYERLKAGEKSELNGERVAALMKLGFELVSKIERKTFDERALEWFEFKTKHGHEKDKTLSRWTKKIRTKKRALDEGRETNLTQEQVNKLTAWGFKWDTGFVKPAVVTARKSWDERFADLCKYKEENGHVNVPQRYPVLGNWVHRQREEYRNRIMTVEKIKKLTEVGFVWSTRKSRKT